MSWLLSVVQAVITLSVVTLTSLWFWYQWTRRRQLAFARTLPTVLPAWPLLGNLPYIRTTVKVGCWTEKLFRGDYAKGMSCLWIGPVPWMVLNKAEDIRIILNNSQTLEKGSFYSAMVAILGNGLLTAPVHMWKTSRKQLNPMFSSQNLQGILPTVYESADILVRDVAKHVGDETFDMETFLFAYSLRNILKLLYGSTLNMDQDSEQFTAIIKMGKRLSMAIAERILNPHMQSDIIFRLLKRQDWNLVNVFQGHIKELNQKSQASRENKNNRAEHETGKNIIDVFRTLSSINPHFDEQYKIDEITTLILTGSDSTAITVSTSLVALGVHPEIQETLYREIVSVAGEGPGPVHLEDLPKMVYLDQVLKETVRRFVTVPVVGRTANKDIQLRDEIIPKGLTVVLSILGLHMDPTLFPDPYKFDPDRFSPENVAKMDNYSFLPFSGGPRGCIAKTYSWITMKIALVNLLREYEFRSDLDLLNMEMVFAISTKSKWGYPISIKKRKLNTQVV